jgi:hypothetical protein
LPDSPDDLRVLREAFQAASCPPVVLASLSADVDEGKDAALAGSLGKRLLLLLLSGSAELERLLEFVDARCCDSWCWLASLIGAAAQQQTMKHVSRRNSLI